MFVVTGGKLTGVTLPPHVCHVFYDNGEAGLPACPCAAALHGWYRTCAIRRNTLVFYLRYHPVE
eukprot:1051854-Prorocentrum_lima.AAC.1